MPIVSCYNIIILYNNIKGKKYHKFYTELFITKYKLKTNKLNVFINYSCYLFFE